MADPTPSPSASAPAASPAALSFSLDGRRTTAAPGELLISAAEKAGTYIPRFCYHPRMEPVGMCRMCLVEVEGPRGATLQPACFIPVTESMVVVTDSEKVKKAQDAVLEFLLVNHPLDCPVCDKGGECPLQDQTLAYGPGESRFIEEKRHFEKPIPISDLVLLDRERCIQCARCTRFAEEIAGEAQIDFAGRGENVEVATFPGEPFSSYFSGNTVQICPVGALTATPYRFAARPWDLDQVESTCTTCALGCRTAVQSSANRLTRLLGIDADPVNHGWLCDKGRFAFESVNGATDDAVGENGVAAATTSVAVAGQLVPGRMTEPMVRKAGEMVPVGWNEALAAAAAGLAAARSAGGPGAIAVLGGARSTNEGAYAWSRLAKGVIGTDTVDCQVADGLPARLVLGLPRATIDETCAAKTVILLSGDIREELPVLFLRLRRAVLDGKTRLVELSPTATSLTPYAAARLPIRPGDAPAVARAISAAGEGASGASPSLVHPEGPAWTAEDLAAARAVLDDQGEGTVVVLGRPSMAEHEDVIANAACALAAAWPRATFLPALRRGNVMGALDMGLAPGILPGRVALDAGAAWFGASSAWGSVPRTKGLDAMGAVRSLAGVGDATGTDRVRAIVSLGTDLEEDFPDAALARKALGAADFVVAVSGHRSAMTDRADVILPVAVEHERPGSVTNIEGRVTRLGQKLVAPGLAWPDWMIASELASALGVEFGYSSVADIGAEIERLAPAYEGVTGTLLDAPEARDGVCVPLRTTNRVTAPLDPMAVPGIDSVERQGAPPRVGPTDASIDDESDMLAQHAGGARPPMLGMPASADIRISPPDSYSLRLVAGRRLYDHGAAVRHSPSLLNLVPEAVVRANPYDLDRLGVTTGGKVTIRSPKGAMVLAAKADIGVPKGVVSVDFGVPSASGSIAGLIDVDEPVIEIRMESL